MAELAINADPPLLSGAVYHCQQAFEKALKAFLTWHGHPFRRTHDLAELVGVCEQADPSFSTLEAAADVVTPYATAFRYPPVLLGPSESDASDALRFARQAVSFTLTRLPPTVHP